MAVELRQSAVLCRRLRNIAEKEACTAASRHHGSKAERRSITQQRQPGFVRHERQPTMEQQRSGADLKSPHARVRMGGRVV